MHRVQHLSCFCPRKHQHNDRRHTLPYCLYKDGSPVTIEDVLAAPTLLVARHASLVGQKGTSEGKRPQKTS